MIDIQQSSQYYSQHSSQSFLVITPINTPFNTPVNIPVKTPVQYSRQYSSLHCEECWAAMGAQNMIPHPCKLVWSANAIYKPGQYLFST